MIGIEYNLFGPKPSDISGYLREVAIDNTIVRSLYLVPIANPNYKTALSKLTGVRMIVAEAPVDKAAVFEKVHTGTGKSLEKLTAVETIAIVLKFKSSTEQEGQGFLARLFNMESKSPGIFAKLKAKARVQGHESKLVNIDLLQTWLQEEVQLEKNPSSKTIMMTSAFATIKKLIIKYEKHF